MEGRKKRGRGSGGVWDGVGKERKQRGRMDREGRKRMGRGGER